jgi:hypothetical protein
MLRRTVSQVDLLVCTMIAPFVKSIPVVTSYTNHIALLQLNLNKNINKSLTVPFKLVCTQNVTKMHIRYASAAFYFN